MSSVASGNAPTRPSKRLDRTARKITIEVERWYRHAAFAYFVFGIGTYAGMSWLRYMWDIYMPTGLIWEVKWWAGLLPLVAFCMYPKLRVERIVWLWGLACVYVMLWVYLATTFDLAAYGHPDILFEYHFWLAYESLFCLAFGWMLRLTRTYERVTGFVLTLALCIMVAGLVDFETMQLSAEVLATSGTAYSIIIADTMIVCGFITAMWARRPWVPLALMVIVTAGVFFSWSRTGMVAALIAVTVVVLGLIFASKANWRLRLAALLIPLGVVGYLAYSIEDYDSHRMTRWILIEDEDKSLLAREAQLQHGINTIKDNPILGRLGSDLQLFGDEGNYVHSHLEVWRQYGIVPFALMLVGAVIAVWRLASAQFMLRDPYMIYGVGLMAALLVEAIYSRSFGYTSLWFGAGAVLSRIHYQQRAHHAAIKARAKLRRRRRRRRVRRDR